VTRSLRTVGETLTSISDRSARLSIIFARLLEAPPENRSAFFWRKELAVDTVRLVRREQAFVSAIIAGRWSDLAQRRVAQADEARLSVGILSTQLRNMQGATSRGPTISR
jgi:hypothetical protein